MAYKHGMYSDFEQTISASPAQGSTTAVYIGTAPVNLVLDWKSKGLVNMPIKLSNMEQVKAEIGYSTEWNEYSLCEAFSMHFGNNIEPAGPIVAINVLDPDVHKAAGDTTTEVSFINKIATIVSDRIILDSVLVEGLVKDTEYRVGYDYSKGAALIYNLSESEISKTNVTYSTIDPALVETEDVTGNATTEGEYSGLGCVNLVYPELNLEPNILAAPGYSEIPEVYQAMIKAASKINGHWNAMVNADIPVREATMIGPATQWKIDNEYTSEFSKVYWPMWELKTGEVYHLSTIATWRMVLCDMSHDGIPMESESNKEIPAGRHYFGVPGLKKGYDQQSANALNQNGITTAIYWGGRNVIWGPHTAAYEYDDRSDFDKKSNPKDMDPRVIFDTNIRMMMYISNSFQRDHGLTIDAPLTRAVIDTILNIEQEKADALVTIGALIGKPVITFKELEESRNEALEGNFKWSYSGTSTPPFKSGELSVAYSTEGFSTYFEGGES